jgi:NAD(P)H-hydrate epimerase
VLTSEANRVIIQTLLPEALFSSYDEEADAAGSAYDKLMQDIKWATAVIIGPGLGKGKIVLKLLENVLSAVKVPVIIDADAINMLGEKLNQTSVTELTQRLQQLSMYLKPGTIITPHLMELSRLTGLPVSDIRDNLIDTAVQCSYNSEIIYVIKDARTIIAQNGKYYINTSGNNGMATGGSGDVLTGIIGALIAQGMSPFEASCLAVYMHGLAGDEAALEKSTYSMMAGDIVEAIGKVIKVI